MGRTLRKRRAAPVNSTVRAIQNMENKMNSLRVSFSNTTEDDFGMPTQYHSYFIIGRPARNGESANISDGIARVYTSSLQAVSLNPDHVIATGGADNAIEAALEKLRELNQGLVERIHKDEKP